MTDGGNGKTLNLATCESCGLPDRVGRVELVAMRAERDVCATTAAVHQEGLESRHRDENLRNALGEVHRIVAEVLQSIRDIEARLA